MALPVFAAQRDLDASPQNAVQRGDSLGTMPFSGRVLRQRVLFLALTLAAFFIGCPGQKLEAQVPHFPVEAPSQARSASQPIPSPPSTPGQTPQLTPEDVTSFLDGFLPLQMQRDDVAGVTIAVTMDGKPLIMKGYGYADWNKKTPVDAVKTTFRLGSISKLFTYTAMMQQVELGRLDLDTDVNRYLDFRIEPGPRGIGAAPVTLRQLATHTAGFEEELHDLGSDQSGKLPLDLRTFLIRNQPHRFARPGTELAYSNYGVALIGYIVQRVSGEDYPNYVQHHIFAPLGMLHSSFVQPLPKKFERSLGYLSTQRPDTGFEGFEETPAGGLSSTASDMSRFGQMLLAGGTLEGSRVLQPSSVALFFRPQFSPAPLILPWNLGFYPERRNGYTFTGHGGDLVAFHSQFWVEPTHRLMFFVSYNSQRATGVARTELFRAFVDRYLPGTVTRPRLLKLSARELAPYAGFYSSSRNADTTKLKLLGPISARRVAVNSRGYLTLSGASDLRGVPLRFAPVGRDTFYNDQQQAFLRFTRDAQGRVDGYVNPSHSARLQGLRNPTFLQWTGVPALFAMMLVLMAAVARTWRRLFQKRRPRLAPQPGTRWITQPLQLALWACLVVLADAALILRHIAHAYSLFGMSHLDGWLRVQNWLATLALLLIMAGSISGARMILSPLRAITRLKFLVVTLSCIWFGWFFLYFHFVGSPTHY